MAVDDIVGGKQGAITPFDGLTSPTVAQGPFSGLSASAPVASTAPLPPPQEVSYGDVFHDHSSHGIDGHLGHAHGHAGHAHGHAHAHGVHAHDGGIGGIFEAPGVGLGIATLGAYFAGRHWGDKDKAAKMGRTALFGYTFVDGMAHAVPAVMALSTLGALAGPLAVVGGLGLGALAFYKGKKDQETSQKKSSKASMIVPAYTGAHAAYHLAVAGMGIGGAVAGHATAYSGMGILGSILGFIYNPIVQLCVAGLSLYMLYKEYKSHKEQKQAAAYQRTPTNRNTPSYRANPAMNGNLAPSPA